MSKNKSVIAKQIVPISKEEKAKLFGNEYLELCKKHGLQVGFAPQWKQSADTGTFSLVVQPIVIEYIEQA